MVEVGISGKIGHWSNELLEKPGGMRSEGPERRSSLSGRGYHVSLIAGKQVNRSECALQFREGVRGG